MQGPPFIVDTGPGRFVAIWPQGTSPPVVIRFKFKVEEETGVVARFLGSSFTQAASEFALGQSMGYLGISATFQAFLLTAIQAKLFGLPTGVWVCYRVAVKVGEFASWFFKG